MLRIARLLAVAAGIGVAVPPAYVAPAVAQSGQGAEVQAAPAEPTTAGLPQRTPPPRTLEAYWPVFVGFSLTWLGIVAYVLTLGRKTARIDELLARDPRL